MINTDTSKLTYSTVADQTAYYPITFVYLFNPANDTPELFVTLDGAVLSYMSDYTVSSSGLQLVDEPDVGQQLIIERDAPLEQLQDYQTGIIDAAQVEEGFDRSVMRDQTLALTINQNVEDIIAIKQEIEELAPVAFSGSYNDLINTPIFATVANTGDYNDLLNKPTIGNGTITITQGGTVKGFFTTNQTGNATIALDSGLTTVDWSDVTNKPTFATVATTGAYNDLTGKPVLATVATSGAYNDLTGKPTIPDTTNMQVTTNLVTSVSSASTDTQYPSAKLFYDTCGDIETLINAL